MKSFAAPAGALLVLMLSIVACATTAGSASTPIAVALTTAPSIPSTMTPQPMATMTPQPLATIDVASTLTPSGSESSPPTFIATPPTISMPTATQNLAPPATPSIPAPTATLPSRTAPLTTPVTPGPKPFVTAPRSADGPVRLRIPKIGVDAPISAVGLDSHGAMATPTTAFSVGWYDLGALPGQPGNAVLDGHLDSAVYGAAVFWRLGELRPGDPIVVQMPTGVPLTFLVEQQAVYPYNGAPLGLIFGPSSSSHLNLITCSGLFDRGSHNYDRRLVVFARLASDHLPP